jgi:hypothetical protein
MSTSYPSTAVTLVDIGEVSNFKAEFSYNFFTTDERVNDEGDIPEAFSTRPSESPTAAYIDRISAGIPRFVKLSFYPVNPRVKNKNNEFRTTNNTVKIYGSSDFSIEDFYDKIIYENSFCDSEFTHVKFMDSAIDNRLFLAVSGSVTQESRLYNNQKRAQIDANIKNIQNNIKQNMASQLDAARFLQSETPDDINAEFITKALSNIDTLGAAIIDESEQKEKRSTAFDRIKDIKLNARINTRILGTAIRAIVNAPAGLLADDFAPYLNKAMSIQDQAAVNSSAATLSLNDYESPLEAIAETPGDGSGASVRYVGYVIEKLAISPDGTTENKDPIFINGINISSVIDFKVAYGMTYSYSIRAISLVTMPSMAEETDEIIDATYLVGSSEVITFAKCIERVPPPPPVDFNVIYRHHDRVPRLTWNFPITRQRDVKKFQVFRRKSINEPFVLLAMYDFDDSQTPTTNNEIILDFLIEKMKDPRVFYDDYEFSRDGSFIYAVACIDAHGLSSSLSSQFEISFDKYKNKIKKRLISASGAPKSYPNLYLLNDAFVDVIKDSGHDRMTVYFDPEFLNVFNTDGSDLGLLTTNNNDGLYKLQFINTDLQQATTLDIIVNDLRQNGD